ncbi:MAG: hypothetical protein ACTSUV_03810 [Candidatus Ranarchaeia archaeon]
MVGRKDIDWIKIPKIHNRVESKDLITLDEMESERLGFAKTDTTHLQVL